MAAKLPPLNAVKAFEASARLGGFSQAARELGVTPGAVSQQVKLLEEFFDKQLFIRRNNQLQLTDAGLAVYADSAQVIERLTEMTRRLLEGKVRSRFVISTLGSVAVHWLNRRLPDFLAAEPELRCEIRVEDDPVDFVRHHIDLRICYGQHLYPEMVTRPLLRDVVTPLCAPAYLAQRAAPLKDPAEIQDSELIHIDWGGSFASYPSWAAWFAAAGAPRSPQVELGIPPRCPVWPWTSPWRGAASRSGNACWRGRNWPKASWLRRSNSASLSATITVRSIRIPGPASAWSNPSSIGRPRIYRKTIGQLLFMPFQHRKTGVRVPHPVVRGS